MYNCVVCLKPLELLKWGDEHKPSDDPLPNQNIDDGCTLQIHRAYGSRHDISSPTGDLYYAVICDNCITNALLNRCIHKFKYIKQDNGRFEEVE